MKYEYEFEDRWMARVRRDCNIGSVVAAITAVVSWAGTTAAAVTAASTAAVGATATGIAEGAVIGAGLGAGEAAITGGDPGMGALGGAISGGVLSGAGPLIGGALSDAGMVGANTAGDVLAGAAGGTLSAAATGGDLGMGAVTGAGSGLIQAGLEGNLSPDAAPNAAGQPTPGGTGGAAPGVESVTVHAPSAPGVTPTLAGLQAPTNQQKPPSQQTSTSGGQIGTISGTGSNVLSGTGGNVLSGTGGAAASDVEGVTVTHAPAPNTLTPTGAGLASSAAATAAPAGITSGEGTGDDLEKKLGQQPTDELYTGTDTTSGGGSFLDKLGTNTENMLANPTALLAGGALLADASGLFHGGNAAGNVAGGTGANAAQLQQAAAADVKQADKLNQLGDANVAQGQQLQGYLTSGTLPPGMQAQIDAQREGAKAATHQMYANMGMGQGNSSMVQDLANIDMLAAAASSKMAENLWSLGEQSQTLGANMFQQALSATNADTNIYSDLLKTNMAQDNNLSAGVNNFVTALATMSKASSNATSGTA